jgi:uncharacterized protein YndB with AHSA1/START domain
MTAKRITLERVYDADIRDVWELWTTKDGIESWWGPGGFKVTVRKLDLRPGGTLLYDMTAVNPPQVEFMKKAGMPLTTEATITYVSIDAPHRLEYVHLTDFIPGVQPYDVTTVVALERDGGRVRMTLSFDPMHSDEWTARATQGWTEEIGKLDALIAQRRASGVS